MITICHAYSCSICSGMLSHFPICVYYCLLQATGLYWMGVAAERSGDMQSGDTEQHYVQTNLYIWYYSTYWSVSCIIIYKIYIYTPAILYYRQAVQLIPDIEFKVHSQEGSSRCTQNGMYYSILQACSHIFLSLFSV